MQLANPYKVTYQTWRYRVGDFRLLCRIEDGELIILVIEIGHRKEIYK